MKFSAAVAAISMASSALAAPQSVSAGSANPCLTVESATTLVGYLADAMMGKNTTYGTPFDTGMAILTEDYAEYSDSVLSLMNNPNLPLGTKKPFTEGRANAAGGLAYAPPVQSIQNIEVLVAGCHKFVWYWLFKGISDGKTVGPLQAKGLNIFTTQTNNGTLQLASNHFEFNSIAWGTDSHQLPPQCYGSSNGSSTTTAAATGTATASTPPANTAAAS